MSREPAGLQHRDSVIQWLRRAAPPRQGNPCIIGLPRSRPGARPPIDNELGRTTPTPFGCSVPPLRGGSRFGQYQGNQALVRRRPLGRRTSKRADGCRDWPKRPFPDGKANQRPSSPCFAAGRRGKAPPAGTSGSRSGSRPRSASAPGCRTPPDKWLPAGPPRGGDSGGPAPP